jgi:uncharacterized membrane protein HdeD (DUF308 family)
MKMTSLVHNWWMIAIRGVLAVAFGAALSVWPDVTLSIVVLFFGIYAIADGAWSIAAGVHASARVVDAWPILLEGAVSVGLGALALGWPFVAGKFVPILAAWGLLTGVLELAEAVRMPRRRAPHWIMGTAGVSSLFLAGLLLLVPRADDGFVVRVITAYAEVFGAMLIIAAVLFARDRVSAGARPYSRASA